MEKTIESIWKEGFLSQDALIAPKINNLYEQKSMHIISKLRRMYLANIYAIVIMSIAILILYWAIGSAIAGVVIFVMLNALAIFSVSNMRQFNHMDQTQSNYDYLKTFRLKLDTIMSKSITLMRFFYPIVVLAAISTIWQSVLHANEIDKMFDNSERILFGLPYYWSIVVTIILGMVAYFSDTLYRWDVNLVYGRVFRKLDELIRDMEELRN